MADNAMKIVWTSLVDNEKGFVKKYDHKVDDLVLATFAVRKAKRGFVLYARIGDSKDAQLNSVCPIAMDNLDKTVRDFIVAELDGPTCDNCHGTGIFIKRNGDEGECFRCKGKGYQSKSDQQRNKSYDARQGNSSMGSVSDATI